MEETKKQASSPSVSGTSHATEEFAAAKADSTAYGGQGGMGGQALNITYVDNFALLMVLYPLLQLLNERNDENSKVSFSAIEQLFQSVIEEQQEHRKALLKAIKSLQNGSASDKKG